MLRELVPGVALIGVLMNTDNPNVEINTRDLEAAARAMGQQILIVGASLISYGASQIWASEQAGVYMGRILKGEKPGDLPVVQPTKFELVINRRTAKTLGLDVPPTLLARADEVIE
jgi:ABC-type uncharacterized transport system substrate-binding protein